MSDPRDRYSPEHERDCRVCEESYHPAYGHDCPGYPEDQPAEDAEEDDA